MNEARAVTTLCYFVAGTDTGVGKTRVTTALLAAARNQGMTVAGMKPVAAGAEWRDGHLISEDAVFIGVASGQSSPYEEINPYCLLEPVSPHIAAKSANIVLDITLITEIAAKLKIGRDLLLIEGAGVWYAPISDQASMADVAVALACPVVLVVGLKLGCLNHARLTVEAIHRSGCAFAGWIGNEIDPHFAALAENLATLERLIGTQPIAILPYAAESFTDARQMRNAIPRLLASRSNQNA